MHLEERKPLWVSRRGVRVSVDVVHVVVQELAHYKNLPVMSFNIGQRLKGPGRGTFLGDHFYHDSVYVLICRIGCKRYVEVVIIDPGKVAVNRLFFVWMRCS